MAAALMVIGICFSCSQDDKPNDSNDCEPDGLLTYKEADSLESNYKKYQYAAINQGLSTDNMEFLDNREFLFELDDLQCYLDYVRKAGADAGIPSSDMGIRVYLGARFEEGQERPHTQVFFVPTANTASRSVSEGDTFYPVQPKDYGSSGKPPKELNQQ